MPETAAGRGNGHFPRTIYEQEVDAIEAEARALGRAEALPTAERLAEAVGAFVTDLTGRPFRTDADEVRRFLLPRLAADDDPELDAYAAGFNPARHADGEEL